MTPYKPMLHSTDRLALKLHRAMPVFSLVALTSLVGLSLACDSEGVEETAAEYELWNGAELQDRSASSYVGSLSVQQLAFNTSERIAGISVSTWNNGGHNVLVQHNEGDWSSPGAKEVLTVADHITGNSPHTGGDWAFNYHKLECDSGQYVSQAFFTPNYLSLSGILCQPASQTVGDYNLCNVRGLTQTGDSYGSDWAPTYYKLSCTDDEYVAGISVTTTDATVHSILCCPVVD